MLRVRCVLKSGLVNCVGKCEGEPEQICEAIQWSVEFTKLH